MSRKGRDRGRWVGAPRAVTIANSLTGGCGLSHECVVDGCKDTCVKFGGQKLDRTGDVYGKYNACIG